MQENYRDYVLENVKGQAKDNEQLGFQLGSLVSTLKTRNLTEEDYNSGRQYRGYLYNEGFKSRVYLDGNRRFLYAGPGGSTSLVVLTIQRTNRGLEIKDSFAKYVNWKDWTGAAILSDVYSEMQASSWLESDTFIMTAASPRQNFGTWSKTNDEIYVRKNVTNTSWKFEVIDVDSFSEEDRLIYEAHLKM